VLRVCCRRFVARLQVKASLTSLIILDENEMVKLFRFLIVAAVSVVIGRLVAIAIYEQEAVTSSKSTSATAKNLEKTIADLASQTNRKLPLAINDHTRLINVYPRGTSLRLNHSIIDFESWAPQDVEKLGEDLPKSVCMDLTMSTLLENGATLTYAYYTKSGAPIKEIPILLSQCKSKK
jgi:hypothetical protein